MRICDMEGCNAIHYAKGFCRKHYYHYRIENMTEICSVPKCGRKVYYSGLCKRHVHQISTHGKIFGNPAQSRRDPNIIEICNDECRIHLHDRYGFTKQIAVIDAGDYQKIADYKWTLNNYGYAAARIEKQRVLLHRMVMPPCPAGYEIDHIDRDRLNNKKSNLRVVSRGQNTMNRPGDVGCTSQYKGVCWSHKKQKYVAQIAKEGKHYFIGHYDSEIMAAKAYNKVANKLFGKYGWLNDVPD